jgi:HK97 gp10 family phage protein
MAVEVSCDVKGVREFQAAMRIFQNAMQTCVHRQLVQWAADVKAEAMQRAPVRTGHLRSSIYAVVREWVVNIGAEATYALFVEVGTRYMHARPYLWPSIQAHLPWLEQIVKEAIDAAKAEAGFR